MKKILGNNTPIPKDKTEALELVIRLALKMAYTEKITMDTIDDSRYTEEHLRYTVMAAISEIKYFGTFPNTPKSEYHLAFQFNYRHYENDEDPPSQLKPDIVSLKRTKVGQYSVNNPLVIELKKDGNNPKEHYSEIKDLKERIRKLGSCIESDILKSRIYLTKVKDSETFEIGVVINLITKKPTKTEFNRLEKMLERQRNEINEYKIDSHKNILFAWYNPLINEPELIRLNQKDRIKLGKADIKP